MAQPEPDPLINRVKEGQPALIRNMFTVNPNLIISCWVCVGFVSGSWVVSNIATPMQETLEPLQVQPLENQMTF